MRELHGEAPELLGLVADALQVGDDLDDGDDEPQVAGRGLAPRQHARALLVDLDLEGVHVVVGLRDLGGEVRVALEQGRQAVRHLALDEPAHGQHLVADGLQLEVELLRDVLVEMELVHAFPVSE